MICVIAITCNHSDKQQLVWPWYWQTWNPSELQFSNTAQRMPKPRVKWTYRFKLMVFKVLSSQSTVMLCVSASPSEEETTPSSPQLQRSGGGACTCLCVCVPVCVNTYRKVLQNGFFSPLHFLGNFCDVFIYVDPYSCWLWVVFPV